jgi:hypothetical protein
MIGDWALVTSAEGLPEACQVAEGRCCSPPGALPIAQALHERRAVPFAGAFLQPNHPTREFGSWLFPELPAWLPFRGDLRRASYHATWHVLFRIIRAANDAARSRVLDLGPGDNPFAVMLRERLPTLYGLSSAVLPRPADWGPELSLTGYWFLDRLPGWTPPRELTDFLAAGPAPICVGFGSMPSVDPEQTTELFTRALALAGRRGILLTGWGGLTRARLPESVLALESAPHDWLFPRVAAVVHHGGAGTTAAALRAGVPALVIPFIADQRFWGQRLTALGAGLGPLARRQLSPEPLAAARRASGPPTARAEQIAASSRARGLARSLFRSDGAGARPATRYSPSARSPAAAASAVGATGGCGQNPREGKDGSGGAGDRHGRELGHRPRERAALRLARLGDVGNRALQGQGGRAAGRRH